ncbi:PDC sensor domain-containing protein [Dictyobacter formicarum]|uniref:Cache domain-containing protein n=1 Tax=Dictyobacter formicarum TaxID=2778368 RepID=A0ABQ3VGS5_9CHLR|nr:cache domain-containing protein [Dictyobacter formicarum]GHO85018.1 hypothetical protein KSZ_30240 [Dictyobacter formicarum]
MAQKDIQAHRRGWFPLPLRISIGYVFAAIIPLLLVVVFIKVQTQPTLINQANDTMTSDAQTRVQLIDNYFRERTLDAMALTQVPSVQQFMALSPADTPIAIYKDGLLHSTFALQAGLSRSKDYSYWALFNAQGHLIQSYPTGTPQRGNAYITPEQLKSIKAGKTFISPVYYDPKTNVATVDIYAPIFTLPVPNTKPQVLGFMRATLKMDYIWKEVVQKDANVHGKNSYAFIVDENGVRIADTDPNRLFTSIKPLSSTAQQQILNQQRYGNKSQIQAPYDPALGNHTGNNRGASEIFNARPQGQQEDFEVVRQATTSVPWQYFVLSPVSSVTSIANQQMSNIFWLAGLAALVVAIGGFFAGIGISRPIMRAVESLRGNSQALNILAQSQQDAAGEQVWVVDSSQVGLQSVQYYTEAAKVASEKLNSTTQLLRQHGNQLTPAQVEQVMEDIMRSASYLVNALEYQHSSNQKLATALKVATQVTEQLQTGASSATDAAEQLERVVQELRSVVGR